MAKTGKIRTERDEAEVRGRGRWSCCLNLIAVGGLLLAGLAVFGFQWFVNLQKQIAVSHTGTGTEESINRWLDEPVKLPAEYWQIPPEYSKGFASHLDKVLQKARVDTALSAMNDMPGAAFGTGWGDTSTTLRKIAGHEALDTTDSQAITSFTTALPGYLAEADALIANPEYRINSRELAKDAYSLDEGNAGLLLPYFSRIALEAYNGNITSATTTLRKSLELIRTDAGYTIQWFTTEQYVMAFHTVASYTSNTLELRELLKLMEEARPQLVNMYNEISFIGPQYLKLAVMMKEDGFIPRLPETRREFYIIRLKAYQYARFLNKKAHSSPERAAAVDRAFDPAHELTGNELIDMIVRPLIHDARVFTEGCYGWSGDGNSLRTYKEQQLQYDILMLRIARRIARLEEKSELTTPEDFTPEYMKTYPLDPMSTDSSPLRYDAVGTDFYSVGHDGVPQTSDDIYGLINDEYQLPESFFSRPGYI